MFSTLRDTQQWISAAYLKEDCISDPGWCFKAAVGTSLPQAFFSYGHGPITDARQLDAITDAIASMRPPPASDIMAKSLQDNTISASGPSNRQRVWSSNPSSQHRFEAIHVRRHSRQDMFQQRDLQATRQFSPQGYEDGFSTAKLFALNGCAKLGFVEQYMSDKRLAAVITPRTESDYRYWFLAGLQEGEKTIKSILNP
jgi:hypothetical protein